MILDDIIEAKKKELKELCKDIMIKDISEKRYFGRSLIDPQKINIIGEIKKASPSKGLIRENFDPVSIAMEYEKSDVQCISVLTDRKYFSGDINYIKKVREVTSKPILRKDFLIEPFQIYESKQVGADAVLLIAAVLDKEKIQEFIKIAESIDLECLVEVHDQNELFDVLNTDAKIIGINNRDLKTFTVNVKKTYELLKYIPEDIIIISESGIESPGELRELYKNKVNAVLIGEYFMRSTNIKEAVRSIRGES